MSCGSIESSANSPIYDLFRLSNDTPEATLGQNKQNDLPDSTMLTNRQKEILL